MAPYSHSKHCAAASVCQPNQTACQLAALRDSGTRPTFCTLHPQCRPVDCGQRVIVAARTCPDREVSTPRSRQARRQDMASSSRDRIRTVRDREGDKQAHSTKQLGIGLGSHGMHWSRPGNWSLRTMMCPAGQETSRIDLVLEPHRRASFSHTDPFANGRRLPPEQRAPTANTQQSVSQRQRNARSLQVTSAVGQEDAHRGTAGILGGRRRVWTLAFHTHRGSRSCTSSRCSAGTAAGPTTS